MIRFSLNINWSYIGWFQRWSPASHKETEGAGEWFYRHPPGEELHGAECARGVNHGPHQATTGGPGNTEIDHKIY